MDKQKIVKWWKTQAQLDDWLFDVREAVGANFNTTETYKKQRLKELELYESWDS